MLNDSVYQKMMEYMKITAEAAGFANPQSLPAIIGALIGTFLSLIGVIFLCLIIYGGFLWMTAAGNESKVLKAKKLLTESVIGLIIILASYAITRFVFDALLSATG
jgi:hypothetical protein